MALHEILILFAGGILAGMINVMAGGAGFMTFPLLIAAGLTEMEANACNFVALIPANLVGCWVNRREIVEVRENLGIRMVLAAVGGVAGSMLFIWLGQANFHVAIPWLLLFATVSFATGPLIKKWLETTPGFDGARWLWLSFVLEFIVYVYGGYFGLGMGIIMLAIHSIFSNMNIHQANAIRNSTIALMTLISIAIFAHAGIVRWIPALVMMGGAVAGGYGMAQIARKLPIKAVRIGILCWSCLLTGYSFIHYR